MKKFRFRLQKVVEYRESMEQWAQEAYLETRIARLEAEEAVREVQRGRDEALARPASSLDERKHLELILLAIDDDERAKSTIASVLAGEEAKALEAWHEKKRELDTILKLRDKAYDEWNLDQSRREQAALDEWAVLKRGA